MKKFNLLAAFAAIILLGTSSCDNKKDDPAPVAPTMTGITITGEGKAFVADIAFSQGVYSMSDKTGNLSKESFTLTIDGGSATMEDYTVAHTAGQSSAKINITLSDFPAGNESLVVKPSSATSIYDENALAMSTDQTQEASFEGNIVLVEDKGTGTGTTTWTANNTYILQGLVFVNDGQTLTIEPGTVIKGRAGQGENASALIVGRGGKLMAEGTAELPIIFTAEADDLAGSVADLDDGLWGGVIVLGHAMLNTVPNEQQIEGIPQTEPRGIYGGTNDEDNSGVLKYISIRHGGTDIGEGNEINGLTLGGVGSATVFDYIEIISNKDDGVEFFGGKPQLSHIIVAFCGDDSYDYDQGYRGMGQFWAAIQGFDRGDRLGEHDGGTDPETGIPYAIPQIYNVTYLGRGDGAGKRVITFRDNAGGHYANSIFYSQEKGIDIELLSGECSYTRFGADELTLKNNLFYSISSDPIFTISAADDVDPIVAEEASGIVAAYFAAASNVVYDPGFTVTTELFNIIPTNDVSGNMATVPVDNFFQIVNYKGAFDQGANWAQGWTLVSKYMGN
ncbi:MAG: hypothetical protein HQ521_09225 [Bacteroidetes bacterium]|nr:hypothetical protein [Bacteroidota bacterium]